MDIAVVETLNGGDIQVNKTDVDLFFHGENNIYLALFGGNVEQSIKKRVRGDQDLSYWGNDLLYPNNAAVQFNSDFERALRNTPLTSSGRVILENAAKNDLNYLSKFGEVHITIKIVDTNRIDMLIYWYIRLGVKKKTSVTIQKGDDGDFFPLDFNEDFL